MRKWRKRKGEEYKEKERNRYRKKRVDQQRDYKKRNINKYRKYQKKYQRRYYLKDKKKQMTRQMTRRKYGKLKKGYQYHHDDYDNPDKFKIMKSKEHYRRHWK